MRLFFSGSNSLKFFANKTDWFYVLRNSITKFERTSMIPGRSSTTLERVFVCQFFYTNYVCEKTTGSYCKFSLSIRSGFFFQSSLSRGTAKKRSDEKRQTPTKNDDSSRRKQVKREKER